MATAVCVYAPVVASLAFAYEEVSPWSALLFLAPALAAQQLFSLYQEKARLYEEQVVLSEGVQIRQPKAQRGEPLLCDGASPDAGGK